MGWGGGCGYWGCDGNHPTPPAPEPEADRTVTISQVLEAARAVRNATSLDALEGSLMSYERLWAEYRENANLADEAAQVVVRNNPEIAVGPEELPRFGGDRPAEIDGVVSWDEGASRNSVSA